MQQCHLTPASPKILPCIASWKIRSGCRDSSTQLSRMMAKAVHQDSHHTLMANFLCMHLQQKPNSIYITLLV